LPRRENARLTGPGARGRIHDFANHSGRGRNYFHQGNFKAAAEALLRANELEDDAYSMIWHYLARERAGENGAVELAANAARLKSKNWPYPVIELYLGRRSLTEVLSAASKPEEVCEAQFFSANGICYTAIARRRQPLSKLRPIPVRRRFLSTQAPWPS
jgi:lipoprotein NlpI